MVMAFLFLVGIWTMYVRVHVQSQILRQQMSDVPSCALEMTRVAVLDEKCASHTAIDPSAPPETGIGCVEERSTPSSSSGTCVMHVTAPLCAPVSRNTTCHLST